MGISKRVRERKPTNLYQRDGIWYARLTSDGREHRQSLKTGNRAEAERRLAGWLTGKSLYHGTIRHTFSEAASLWMAAGEWKPKTLQGYIKLSTVLDTYFAGFFWDQVDKVALQRFVETRREAGSGTATINRYLSVISGIADHVRELDGWPDFNPVKALPKKPRREKRQAYVRPPVEDIEALFLRMRGTFGDICRLALLTGARKDELAMLKAVDARNGRLQLWQTKHEFRVIPLTGEALAIVNRQPEHRCGYLFVTRNGGPYKRVTEMWREVVRRAQNLAQRTDRTLTTMRFHDLRHEYAIRYLETAGSLYALQKLLGHSTIKQTEQYLRYVTPDQAAMSKQ